MIPGLLEYEMRNNPQVSWSGAFASDIIIMIPGSKGLNPHEPAQMWVNALETRQNMSIKVGHKHHDMRIFCRIVGVRST